MELLCFNIAKDVSHNAFIFFFSPDLEPKKLKTVFYYVKSVNDLRKKSAGFWHVLYDVFGKAHKYSLVQVFQKPI